MAQRTDQDELKDDLKDLQEGQDSGQIGGEEQASDDATSEFGPYLLSAVALAIFSAGVVGAYTLRKFRKRSLEQSLKSNVELGGGDGQTFVDGLGLKDSYIDSSSA